MTNTRHSGGPRTTGRDSQGRFTGGNRNGSNSNRNRKNDGYYNLRYHEDENRNRNNDSHFISPDNYDLDNFGSNYDDRNDNRREMDYDDYENQRGGRLYSGDWDDRRGSRSSWASFDEPSYERDRNDTYNRDEDRSRYFGSEGRRGFDDHREFNDRHTYGSRNRVNDKKNSTRGRGFASLDEHEPREVSARGGRASHRGSGSTSRGSRSGKTKTSYSQRAASLRRSNRSRNKSH